MKYNKQTVCKNYDKMFLDYAQHKQYQVRYNSIFDKFKGKNVEFVEKETTRMSFCVRQARTFPEPTKPPLNVSAHQNYLLSASNNNVRRSRVFLLGFP